MKSVRKLTIYQSLIHKFILEEYKSVKGFWGKETKLLKGLASKYSIEFFEWLSPPFGYKINSFLYFMGKDGTDYLRGQYFEFLKTKINLTPEQPKHLDNSTVIGDNIEIVKKPKNLEEFLSL